MTAATLHRSLLSYQQTRLIDSLLGIHTLFSRACTYSKSSSLQQVWHFSPNPHRWWPDDGFFLLYVVSEVKPCASIILSVPLFYACKSEQRAQSSEDASVLGQRCSQTSGWTSCSFPFLPKTWRCFPSSPPITSVSIIYSFILPLFIKSLAFDIAKHLRKSLAVFYDPRDVKRRSNTYPYSFAAYHRR